MKTYDIPFHNLTLSVTLDKGVIYLQPTEITKLYPEEYYGVIRQVFEKIPSIPREGIPAVYMDKLLSDITEAVVMSVGERGKMARGRALIETLYPEGNLMDTICRTLTFTHRALPVVQPEKGADQQGIVNISSDWMSSLGCEQREEVFFTPTLLENLLGKQVADNISIPTYIPLYMFMILHTSLVETSPAERSLRVSQLISIKHLEEILRIQAGEAK